MFKCVISSLLLEKYSTEHREELRKEFTSAFSGLHIVFIEHLLGTQTLPVTTSLVADKEI